MPIKVFSTIPVSKTSDITITAGARPLIKGKGGLTPELYTLLLTIL